jgi:hypothetical protein
MLCLVYSLYREYLVKCSNGKQKEAHKVGSSVGVTYS